jgi:multidrug efflux system membrane fusion protein
LQKDGSAITQAQIDTQAALVDQYNGQVLTDQGVIDADNVNLRYCEVRAPFAGRIGLRLVDPGNIVHASDTNPVAVITQVQPITVIFVIAEDDIPKVMGKYDAAKSMTVEAWNRDLTTKLATGKVLAIDNQVDPTTGTVKIRAIFDNTHDELFPNEFTNARLLVDTLTNVVLVPAAAVQRGPDSNFVYVVTLDDSKDKDSKSGTVNVRTITLGATEADQTVIESGLTPGDIVVTDGVDKLEKGTKVKIADRAGKKKAAASQPGATQSSSEVSSPAAAAGPEGTTTNSSGEGNHRHPKQGAAE